MTHSDVEKPVFEATTQSIRVSVQPVYLEDQSHPDKDHFVWAYIVNVANEGQTSVQLLNRHWIITDAMGYVTEVRGEGVVGEQPILEPGDCYEYTSGTPLNTAHGLMKGNYEMKQEDGDTFWIEIPTFALDGPQNMTLLN